LKYQQFLFRNKSIISQQPYFVKARLVGKQVAKSNI